MTNANQPPNQYAGYAPQPGYPGAPLPPAAGNGIAVAAMVLGILSIVLFFVPFLNLLLGTLGLIMGIVGMKKSRTVGGKGNGMAIAGLVTGIIGTLWGLFMAVVIVSGTKVHI